MGGGVPVQAGDPGPGQEAPHFAFHLFGAYAVLLDGSGLALGAVLRNFLEKAAVMADEAVRGLMAGQGDAALAALEDVAAKEAEQGPGIAAAVQKEQGLFLSFEHAFQGGEQGPGDDLDGLIAPLGFQVDEVDLRQSLGGDPAGEVEITIFAGLGQVVGGDLEGWRRPEPPSRPPACPGRGLRPGPGRGDRLPVCKRGRALRPPPPAPGGAGGRRPRSGLPTTTSTSPRTRRRHWSRRAASERPLCNTVTRGPKRERKARATRVGQGDLGQ